MREHWHLLWLTAYSMLVGFEGPTFKVSRFLDIAGRVPHHCKCRTLSGVLLRSKKIRPV